MDVFRHEVLKKPNDPLAVAFLYLRPLFAVDLRKWGLFEVSLLTWCPSF
jgi:hypothetical protein